MDNLFDIIINRNKIEELKNSHEFGSTSIEDHKQARYGRA